MPLVSDRDSSYCLSRLRDKAVVADSVPDAALEGLQDKYEALLTINAGLEQELASAKVS
jgi:hypothetical protein